jgi:hypothetical protein
MCNRGGSVAARISKEQELGSWLLGSSGVVRSKLFGDSEGVKSSIMKVGPEDSFVRGEGQPCNHYSLSIKQELKAQAESRK